MPVCVYCHNDHPNAYPVGWARRLCCPDCAASSGLVRHLSQPPGNGQGFLAWENPPLLVTPSGNQGTPANPDPNDNGDVRINSNRDVFAGETRIGVVSEWGAHMVRPNPVGLIELPENPTVVQPQAGRSHIPAELEPYNRPLPPAAIETGRAHIDALVEDYAPDLASRAIPPHITDRLRREVMAAEDERVWQAIDEIGRSYTGPRRTQWDFLLGEEPVPQYTSLHQRAIQEIQTIEDARAFSEIPDAPRRNQWDHLADGQDELPLTTQGIDPHA